MIKNTFAHLPGISALTEQKLWKQGILTWEDLYEECERVFSHTRSAKILSELEVSFRKFERGDLFYFYNRFPRAHLWKLIPGHESKVAFLDIETTGLGLPPRNSVTTISVLLNGVLYQAHEHAAKRKLVSKMKDEASIVVSYYGEVFDLPFLRKQYNVKIDLAHVDLCFALRRHGFTGGLKKVERRARINFRRKLVGLDGFDAVTLWELYQGGNQKALDTLLAYNAEDTLVLQPLAQKLLKLEGEASKTYVANKFKKVLPKCKWHACKKTVRDVLKRRQESLFTIYF